ncbi:MAG: bile acid:sodium symporter family protein [Planctomycetaceae bacterium]|nr:bile acid:sodium symporter family protein [Planctomycetaceae bacterium]
MGKLVHRFNRLYLLWLLLLSTVAFVRPATMIWFDKPWIFWSLAASMLGMGLTLSLDDFRQVTRMPGCIAAGFLLQYTIMPLSGWCVAALLHLESGLAVGIMLVASCPGGMASNMISYLAKANVAASVVLTLASTVMAFVMTPLWTSLLAGQIVPVDVPGMCLSALQLTVAPVALGVLIRWKFPVTADRIGILGPTVAVLAFTFVTAGIVAASADSIASNFVRLLFAATLLHFIGFGTGYGLAKLLRYPESLARTVSIEVGMQNGGLAASLAREHFAAMPLSAAAAVFSGIIQNIVGGIIAAWWGRSHRSRRVEQTNENNP